MDISYSLQKIYISKNYINQIFTKASKSLPNEICGLFGNKGNSVTKIFPITNVAQSPSRFEMSPIELFHAYQSLDNFKLELGGIYHSHPNGPATLSQTDLNEAVIFDCPHFVISPQNSSWTIQGYMISQEKEVMSTKIEIIAR